MQKVSFIELPDAPIYTPGIAPSVFFITPKLISCNIFVAHDINLHKYWVIRISEKSAAQQPSLEEDSTEVNIGIAYNCAL